MATAAQRAQKKDLGPDWRETLAASIPVGWRSIRERSSE